MGLLRGCKGIKQGIKTGKKQVFSSDGLFWPQEAPKAKSFVLQEGVRAMNNSSSVDSLALKQINIQRQGFYPKCVTDRIS